MGGNKSTANPVFNTGFFYDYEKNLSSTLFTSFSRLRVLV